MKKNPEKIEIQDEVLTPDDGPGIVVEEMPIGEFRVITKDWEVYHFPEDLKIIRKGEA